MIPRRQLRVALSFFASSMAFSLRAAESPKPGAAPGPSTEALKAAGLTAAQLLTGAKSGLSALVDLAATEMAKPGAVQVATPMSMNKLESTLKKLNQSGAFDSFKASLNQAATSVAPQTTAVLKSAIGPLTLADASTLLGGAPDSATKLLRKTSEANLRTKLLPLVSQAVAANGSAAKAKDLLSKAGPMAAMMGVPSVTDLENHVLDQVLETSFGYLAKQEAAVRANPSALKDGLAAKVFGPAKK